MDRPDVVWINISGPGIFAKLFPILHTWHDSLFILHQQVGFRRICHISNSLSGSDILEIRMGRDTVLRVDITFIFRYRTQNSGAVFFRYDFLQYLPYAHHYRSPGFNVGIPV